MKLRHLNAKEKLNYIAGRMAALNKRYGKILDSYYIDQMIYYTEKLKDIKDEIELDEKMEKSYE